MSAHLNPLSHHKTLDHRVKQAFSLTDHDLEVNRAGQMVPSQQKHVENRRTDKFLSLAIGFVMMIVFGCMALSASNAASKGVGFALLCGAVLLTPLGLIMLANMKDDAQANQVLSSQGIVKRRKIWDTKKTTYKVMLPTKTFEVTQQVYEGFLDGETYILYYTPTSQLLVGAEHQSDSIPAPDDTPSPLSNPLTSP